MNNFNLSIDLINAAQNDNLIVFVGAGLSKGLGLPSWRDMVQGILNELALNDNKYSSLKNVFEDKVFTEIEILEKILTMNPINKRKVYDLLVELINKDLSSFDLTIQRKLGELCSRIITTNYDLALETALPEFKMIIHDDEYNIAKIPEHNKYIFKIHGTIDKPQSCIIYESDYEELYFKNNAAIERLKSIITDKTILFVGFSFNDQYVKRTFKYIYDIFKSYNKIHYIITTEDNNFSEYGLMPIKIDSWGNLSDLIDSLLLKRNQCKSEQAEVIIRLQDTPLVSPIFKVAILYANPLDIDTLYNIESIIKYFTKFKLDIDCYHLSEDSLNELEGYNYIFIFSVQVQNKIVIEDEYFRKKLITIKQLEDHLMIPKLDGIFLFLDDANNLVNYDELHYPIAIFNYEEKINNLLFKLFKKVELKQLNPVISFNNSNFILSPVEKGKCNVRKQSSDYISNKIERKNLINFVGRNIDIIDVIRKIQDNQDKIITIKGSGGIGKTTIVKKIAIEFYDRGLYKDGIDFIDCEFIKDYKTFERNIAKTFNLEDSINFIEYVSKNKLINDSLIILDNFEPLLYLEDIETMKKLITFISDYKTVLVTSREWIGFEFEEKHEIRNFTSEEAIILFEKLYSSVIPKEEKKILKEEILEKLLNNNPLAIKIVAQNIPRSINMQTLKDELKDDFFRATNAGYTDIYNNEVDENIERSLSLYQSIYYSYKRLSSREQLVFEILSLFPNGIPIESFKNFFNTDEFRTDIYRITNKEIKSLENKSIIEINGGFISLQSIIGRFAEFHLNKRTEEEKYKYYKRAFAFNSYVLELIDGVRNSEYPVKGLEIFDNIENNFIKSLEYIDKIQFDNLQLISYIHNLASYFHGIGQSKKFRKQLKKCDKIFSNVENGELLKGVITAHLRYYEGDFDSALNYLLTEIPFEKLENLDGETDSYINKIIYNYVLSLYSLEGYEYQIIEFSMKNNIFKSNNNYSELFKIGAYELIEDLTNKEDFFSFELKLNQNNIDIEELDKYIEEGIYNKQYIEIMQTNYIKAKMGIYSKEHIEKLVITNPYTMGIKDLMLALCEKDIESKIELFEQAIEKLDHIKYYYVEAIFYYCKFLYDEKLETFDHWYKTGIELSQKYRYSYHLYRFNSLMNPANSTDYDENDYLGDFKNIFNMDYLVTN
jgi:NAD-dependent SIR2 family protein deacetylase